jgi:hypothetical protein
MTCSLAQCLRQRFASRSKVAASSRKILAPAPCAFQLVQLLERGYSHRFEASTPAFQNVTASPTPRAFSISNRGRASRGPAPRGRARTGGGRSTRTGLVGAARFATPARTCSALPSCSTATRLRFLARPARHGSLRPTLGFVGAATIRPARPCRVALRSLLARVAGAVHGPELHQALGAGSCSG